MTKRLIRYLASRNYYLARMYLTWGFLLSDLPSNEPIIVYQTGKVGSSTVVASLRALRLNRPVYHVHSLTRAGIENGKRMYARIFRSGADRDLRRAHHLIVSQHLCRRIAKGMEGQSWKVISLVRDPIAINVSGFFQIIDHYLPNFGQRYRAGSVKIDDAIRVFLDEFDHEEPLTWFDVELKATLGIDVFGSPFPKSRGYEIYRKEHIEFMVLRLEDIDQRAGEAFKHFLDIENLKLVRSNVADDKSYNTAYREFKDAIKLPRSYLEMMYESRHVRHFYTDEEILGFRTKWLRT